MERNATEADTMRCNQPGCGHEWYLCEGCALGTDAHYHHGPKPLSEVADLNKNIGNRLHDILADSMLECNCDESGKCTACKIDDLAHELSPMEGA